MTEEDKIIEKNLFTEKASPKTEEEIINDIFFKFCFCAECRRIEPYCKCKIMKAIMQLAQFNVAAKLILAKGKEIGIEEGKKIRDSEIKIQLKQRLSICPSIPIEERTSVIDGLLHLSKLDKQELKDQASKIAELEAKNKELMWEKSKLKEGVETAGPIMMDLCKAVEILREERKQLADELSNLSFKSLCSENNKMCYQCGRCSLKVIIAGLRGEK